MALLWCGFVVGWVANIVKLITVGTATGDAEFVLRVVGVVLAPIGFVMGYM
jgi:hypothetical protein